MKPGGQGVHSVAPSAEKKRTAHEAHVATLVALGAAENVPAEQLMMPVPSTLRVPTPPTPGQYAPGVQATGTLTAPDAMYQPASSVQLDRTVAPAVELEPAGQGAEPLVTTDVDSPSGLAVPTEVPPTQYRPAGHVSGVCPSPPDGMCHPADTVQFERKLAPARDAEPAGQAAMPDVANTVPAWVALCTPK